jgi:hypothetical protein
MGIHRQCTEDGKPPEFFACTPSKNTFHLSPRWYFCSIDNEADKVDPTAIPE